MKRKIASDINSAATIWSRCRLLFLALTVFIRAHATSPGKGPMRPLAEGQENFDLFISSFYFGNSNYQGLSLLWIPPFLRSVCLNKTSLECEKIDHCIDYPTNDNCQNYDLKNLKRNLSSKSTYEEHFKERTFGITLYFSNPPPDSQNISQILRALSLKNLESAAIKFGAKSSSLKDGNRYLPLNKKARISALVKWTIWPNGKDAHIVSVEAK